MLCPMVRSDRRKAGGGSLGYGTPTPFLPPPQIRLVQEKEGEGGSLGLGNQPLARPDLTRRKGSFG